MQFLQGRLAYFSLYGATLILVVLYLGLLGWLFPFKYRIRLAVLWPRFASIFWLRVAAGIKLDISGIENLPDEPFIAVSNHQSEWETLYLAYLLCPSSIVMKESLLKIPVYGWGQRLLKPIAIDRSSPKASIKAILSNGATRIEEGNNLLIFPEGTRVDAGEIKRYTRTAFKLAAQTETPIIPIVHNSGDHWVKKGFKPGTIKIRVGKPIYPKNQDSDALLKEAEGWSKNTYNSFYKK